MRHYKLLQASPPRLLKGLIHSSSPFYQKSQSNGPEKEKDGVIQNFKRTLSKKEKKKEKKREKEFARIPDGDEQALAREDG